MKSYQQLSAQYYQMDKPNAPEEELAFFLQYARGDILEPMCGTGRFLIPMHHKGLSIEGFDASPFMLQVLRSACSAHVWEQRLEDFQSPKLYDYIFIPDSSINHILEPSQIRQSFQRIYQHLKPGGVFAFEFLTKEATPTQTQRGRAIRRQGSQEIVLETFAQRPTGDISTTFCRYECFENGQSVASETEEFMIRFYDRTTMREWLNEAGFVSIETVTPFGAIAHTDVLVATKAYTQST